MTRSTNGGNKWDEGKLRMDLLPIKPLQELARVLTFGASKYGDRNWEKGIEYSRVYGAVQRHLTDWWDGKDLDNESKLYLLAHAMCGIAFLLEYQARHTGIDDRPYKQLEE